MQLLTIGLRRSGTTIFWKMLKQDERFVSLDEPFHPMLMDAVFKNPLQNYRDYQSLERAQLERIHAPIDPLEELNPKLTEEQYTYLKYLSEISEWLNLDSVRCAFKIEHLSELLPELKIVFLYRDPRAWASSHLIPTQEHKSLKSTIKKYYLRQSFWSRWGAYNWYHYQDIIEKSGLESSWRSVSGRIENRLSAVRKLVYFWSYTKKCVEQVKPKLGKRLMMISFEDYLRRPEYYFDEIYKWTDLPGTKPKSEMLRPANMGFDPMNSRWEGIIDESAHIFGMNSRI